MKGNPNFGLQVIKKDGTKFTIDITPALQLNFGDKKTHMYIAKEHLRSKEGLQNYELLWLKTNPHREVQYVKKVRPDEKEIMRTAKALLKSRIPNSYLVKTAWLDIIKGHPRQDKFYKNENYLAIGVVGIIIKLKEMFEKGQAESKFNPDENVFERHTPKYVDMTRIFFEKIEAQIRRR